ncbi:MAG: Rap1a/Tai family immunity protein, partial [Deltaproteobacteria bacterium]
IDAHTGYAAVYPENRLFCEPNTVTFEQLVRVVGGYLRKNPKRLDMPSGVLAFEALIEAYPCKLRKPG